MSLDAEARTAKLQGGEEVAFEQGADRDRRQRQHPAGRGRRARGHPLPARVRQLRRDPRRRRGGRAGRADRRQLHRLRGRGLADGEGEASAAIVMMEDVRAVADASATRWGAGSTSCSSRRGSRSSAARRSRRSRATAASSAVVTESGRDGRGRHRRRRRRACEPDVMLAAARRARGRRTGSSATRGSRPRSRGSSPPATCCSYDSVVHGRRLRVEHWDVAFQQGRHVGRAMLGDGSPTTSSPTSSATSPTGRASSTSAPRPNWDEVIWRGDRDAGEFSVFYLDGRQGRRRPLGRPLRGPRPRPAAARGGRRRVGRRRTRWPTPDAISRHARQPDWLLARLLGLSVAHWCNGNTLLSGSRNSGFESLGRSFHASRLRTIGSPCAAR